MTEILGCFVLISVVVGYLRWEWSVSEADRKRRREMAVELDQDRASA